MQWSQDQAIAFECAREAITELMALRSGEISHESSLSEPNEARLDDLRADRARLGRERAALHVGQDAQVARIRADYGILLRASAADRPLVL